MDNSRHSYRWVTLLALLVVISVGVARAADSYDGPSEAQLIEILRSGEPAEKAVACKQLAIHGSKAAVPELAKLLADEQLSSWSRIALEAIPDPAADAALIDAAKALHGQLLVGTINTIGVRRAVGAVDILTQRLNEADADAASASAVALGKIGSDTAIESLHRAFEGAAPAVRSAIAEGGILFAEQLLAEGKKDKAAEIYDLIRNADVPKQRILEATRGAIIARGAQGIPLLVEQLKSPDKRRFALGLKTARELQGKEVTDAISSALAETAPERASLLIIALGDRRGSALPGAVLQSARSGDKQVRLAAIQVIGQMGDASTVPALLEMATDDDADLSAAAKAALASLPDMNVNAELARRLPDAKGKTLAAIIELAGQRRIDAAAELVEVLHHSDDAIRNATLVALGATAGAEDLPLLMSEVTSAKNAADRELAERALQTACIRMPDREAIAAKLAAAMPNASTAAKTSFLRILGTMGGPKALATIAAAVEGDEPELQDVGTRALGEWMTADAAPVLLEITKSTAAGKYRVRAVRGYLRIARQQKMPDAKRLEMFHQGLAICERPEERELALDILKRCPSVASVRLASSLIDDQQTREHAIETAIFIAEKIKDEDPAAAKSTAEKALKAEPNGKLADRARALTKAL